MKKVVIIGGSFAGLSCAKSLGDSEYSVIVLEKDKELGIKVCASGVKDQDLAFIREDEVNFPFAPVYLCIDSEKHQMPQGRGMISSIIRPNILNRYANELIKHKNIDLRFDSKVVSITPNQVVLKNGETLDYDFLVGADGSLSTVRQYLNIPREKYLPAIQYIVPEIYPSRFEIYADSELFGPGYAWIFPNKSFTSIGACVFNEWTNSKFLRPNLEKWLKMKNIDVSNGKFEGFVINFDYRGYKFGNIYLAGDAAGFTNGLTGKGIYGANLSGKVIAEDILGRTDSLSLLEEWLSEKENDEQVLSLKENFVKLKIDSFKNR